MSSTRTTTGRPTHQPSLGAGLFLYLGYLAIFFTTWAINGVDYQRIGESAETTRLWYALPTLFGCAFLVVAITWLGWWRSALFEPTKSGPVWVWVLPAVVAGIILGNFLRLQPDKLSSSLLLWSTLGAVQRPDVLPLDTGCVWGGCLTAARILDGGGVEQVAVRCAQASQPGKG